MALFFMEGSRIKGVFKAGSLRKGAIDISGHLKINGTFKNLNKFESVFEKVSVTFKNGDELKATYLNGQLAKGTLSSQNTHFDLMAFKLPFCLQDSHKQSSQSTASLLFPPEERRILQSHSNDPTMESFSIKSGKVVGSDWVYSGGLTPTNEPDGFGIRVSSQGVYYMASHRLGGQLHGLQKEFSFGFHKFFRVSLYCRGNLHWAKTFFPKMRFFESLSSSNVGRVGWCSGESKSVQERFGEVESRDRFQLEPKREFLVRGFAVFGKIRDFVSRKFDRKAFVSSKDGKMKGKKGKLPEKKKRVQVSILSLPSAVDSQLLSRKETKDTSAFANENWTQIENLKKHIKALEKKISEYEHTLSKINLENSKLKCELQKSKNEDLNQTRTSLEIPGTFNYQRALTNSFASFSNLRTTATPGLKPKDPLPKTTHFPLHFKGQLKSGKKEGYCEEHYKDGSFFRGHYSNGKREGIGLLRTKAFEYKGNFTNNEPSGFGEKVVFKNQVKLAGHFKSGVFTGRQLLVRKMQYEGQIKEDMMHGMGALSFKSRFKFKGLFAKNRLFVGQKNAELFDQENEENYIVEVRAGKGKGKGEVLLVAGNNLMFRFDQEHGDCVTGPFFYNLSLNSPTN